MKKEAEIALTHMIVVPLGPAWRERMPLPCLYIPHHWTGKVQSVATGEWLGREEQKMFCIRLGLRFLLSSSKACYNQKWRQSVNPEHIQVFSMQIQVFNTQYLFLNGSHFWLPIIG